MAVRVTSSEGMHLTSTRRALHRLLRVCKAYDVVVDLWFSILCNAGMPFKWINEKLGAETGDLALTFMLVDVAVGLCRIGGGFNWSWSNDNELWKLVLVRNIFARCGSSSCSRPQLWDSYLSIARGACSTSRRMEIRGEAA